MKIQLKNTQEKLSILRQELRTLNNKPIKLKELSYNKSRITSTLRMENTIS